MRIRNSYCTIILLGLTLSVTASAGPTGPGCLFKYKYSIESPPFSTCDLFDSIFGRLERRQNKSKYGKTYKLMLRLQDLRLALDPVYATIHDSFRLPGQHTEQERQQFIERIETNRLISLPAYSQLTQEKHFQDLTRAQSISEADYPAFAKSVLAEYAVGNFFCGDGGEFEPKTLKDVLGHRFEF